MPETTGDDGRARDVARWSPRGIAARLTRQWGGAYAVLERDFLATTSSKRFLALRLLVALIAAFVVAVTAIASSRAPPDQVGRVVFGAAVIVVPLLVMLIAPATAAPAIATEREGATLDLVLAAPVSAGSFVAAKFAARFLSIGVLVFAMLPIAATCFLFGGVPPGTFLALVVFAATTAAFGVATGLVFSAFLRSPAAAILGALLFVLLAPAAPWALLVVLHETGLVSLSTTRVAPLLPAQPFYVWGELGRAAFAGRSTPPSCWTHAAIMGALSAALLCVAALRVRRENRVSQKAGRVRRARGLFLGRPLLDRRVRGSLLWHPRGRGFVLPALAVIGDVLLLWVAAVENDLDEGWVHVSALGSLTVLAMLVVLAETSTSIASERRRGSFDVLMATPFRPREVALSVLLGTILATAPLLLLGLVHGTIAVFLGALEPLGMFAWIVTTIVLLAFVGALGLRASAAAGSPTKSALWSFGSLFGAMTLAVLAVFLMAVLRLDGDIAAALLLSLPPALAYYAPLAGHQVVASPPFRTEPWMVLPIASLTLYAAGAWLLLRSAIVVLERRGE